MRMFMQKPARPKVDPSLDAAKTDVSPAALKGDAPAHSDDEADRYSHGNCMHSALAFSDFEHLRLTMHRWLADRLTHTSHVCPQMMPFYATFPELSST